MNFYTEEQRYYCGIDLHARCMYLCILNQAGEVVLHQDLPAGPEPFLQAIAPCREDVGVESIFTWYWLADLCSHEKIPFLGIGKVLCLVILYEIHDIRRFPTVQDFVFYARLVKCARESAGKRHGSSGKKIGNVHLKWAFSEAAALFLRRNPEGLKYKRKLEKRVGDGQGPLDPGSQDRKGRLLHAPEGEGVR